MKKLLLILLLFSITSVSFAQVGLGYYFDYSNHFYVFDKGNTMELESNNVDSIRVGNDWLSYIDQRSDLRIYHKGEIHTLEEDVPSQMVATAHALVYKMQQRLMIFENGESKQLSKWVDAFFANDYIITWQDLPSLDIMAYQNGEIKLVEQGSGTKAINNGRTGKNIFAYSDLNNSFKIYHSGEVTDTKATEIRNYKCGFDVVAYIDRFNSTFNVYENGTIKVISNQLPKAYAVTGNTVSYIDPIGNFMAYYNGESIKIESYEPTLHQEKENLIVYYYAPELKVFYNGKNYTLESSTQQQNVTIGINSALYLDDTGHAKYFYNGKLFENFLTEQPTMIKLNRDLPVLYYGNNTIGFYFNGKVYDYQILNAK